MLSCACAALGSLHNAIDLVSLEFKVEGGDIDLVQLPLPIQVNIPECNNAGVLAYHDVVMGWDNIDDLIGQLGRQIVE